MEAIKRSVCALRALALTCNPPLHRDDTPLGGRGPPSMQNTNIDTSVDSTSTHTYTHRKPHFENKTKRRLCRQKLHLERQGGRSGGMCREKRKTNGHNGVPFFLTAPPTPANLPNDAARLTHAGIRFPIKANENSSQKWLQFFRTTS